jgi:hypothetical protein
MKKEDVIRERKKTRFGKYSEELPAPVKDVPKGTGQNRQHSGPFCSGFGRQGTTAEERNSF